MIWANSWNHYRVRKLSLLETFIQRIEDRVLLRSSSLVTATSLRKEYYDGNRSHGCRVPRCRHDPVSTALKLGIVMSRSEKSSSRRDFLRKMIALVPTFSIAACAPVSTLTKSPAQA